MSLDDEELEIVGNIITPGMLCSGRIGKIIGGTVNDKTIDEIVDYLIHGVRTCGLMDYTFGYLDLKRRCFIGAIIALGDSARLSNLSGKDVHNKPWNEPNEENLMFSIAGHINIREVANNDMPVYHTENSLEWYGYYDSQAFEIVICPERIEAAPKQLLQLIDIHINSDEMYVVVLLHALAHAIMDPTWVINSEAQRLGDYFVKRLYLQIDDKEDLQRDEAFANKVTLDYLVNAANMLKGFDAGVAIKLIDSLYGKKSLDMSSSCNWQKWRHYKNKYAKSEYTDILKDLKDNYLFKLSLGSKELFHSNFLEMLWEMDNNIFITMLRQLTDNNKLLPDENTTYYLSREKENFDICIYHEISSRGDNKKPIYDLIIENKVKSIPHQTQLKTYEKKVIKNNHYTNNRKGKNKIDYNEPCAYILLSLVTEFSEKEAIDTERRWIIKSYYDLLSAIDKIYTENDIIELFSEKKDNEQEAKEYIELITKYEDFINNLHELQRLISKNDFWEKPLFDEDAIGEFKDYRLHDLYIKHSCGIFVDKLKQQIEERFSGKFPIYFLSDKKEINKEEIEKKPCIFIHEEMLNVEGSVGVSIYPKGCKGIDYQIIIQGKQYRHCICRNKTNGENNKTLWDEVKEKSFIKSLNIKNETIDISRDFGGQGRDDSIDCCSYTLDKELFVYKYIKIGGDNFPKSAKELLEVMVNDIIKTCKELKIFSNESL